MAKVFIEETTLTAIGDAIRSKTGKTGLIDPLNMGAEIEAIETGSGGSGTDEALKRLIRLTGNCEGKFAFNGYNWIIDEYGDQITSSGVTDAGQLFAYNKGITEANFDLNMESFSNAFHIAQMAMGANNIQRLPSIKFPAPEDYNGPIYINANMAFQNCYSLRSLDNVYSVEDMEHLTHFPLASGGWWYTQQLLCGCYALRHLPAWYYNFHPNWATSTKLPESYNVPYDFNGCLSLDEITNLPVWRAEAGSGDSTILWDAFNWGDSVANCYRLKRFTFETNNGAAIPVKWTSQQLTFARCTGWSDGWSDFQYYNSDINAATRVTNNTTYQALKNNPNWWTTNKAYSRYNLESAIETINTLPDASAFLEETGNETNYITFALDAGSATDGGGITEEALTEAAALAASKGWTVVFE